MNHVYYAVSIITLFKMYVHMNVWTIITIRNCVFPATSQQNSEEEEEEGEDVDYSPEEDEYKKVSNFT